MKINNKVVWCHSHCEMDYLPITAHPNIFYSFYTKQISNNDFFIHLKMTHNTVYAFIVTFTAVAHSRQDKLDLIACARTSTTLIP